MATFLRYPPDRRLTAESGPKDSRPTITSRLSDKQLAFAVSRKRQTSFDVVPR
jgi:hypothetical protein